MPDIVVVTLFLFLALALYSVIVGYRDVAAWVIVIQAITFWATTVYLAAVAHSDWYLITGIISFGWTLVAAYVHRQQRRAFEAQQERSFPHD